MQKVIDQITDQLVGLIKKDQSSYSPQQLLQDGIPSYIVERVRLLLEDKVLADYQKPESQWIELENDLFESSWNDFRSAIVSCSVIPHDKVHEILHNTINDIISVFVEPRKYMALYLFRDEKILSFEEISKRCARLTIYRHFGKAIPLYMQKRELKEISLERCQKLIANLDARIVSNYTAENWAQKLELLFTLFGGKLVPKLLEIFFKDKGLTNAAEVFAKIDVAVTQSTFVEMLSSEKIDFNSVEAESEVVPEEKNPAEIEMVDRESSSTQEEEDESEENLASAFQVKDTEPEINEILGDITEEGIVEADNIEEAASLNALFSGEEDDTEELNADVIEEGTETEQTKEEEREEFRSNISSILDQAKDSFEGTVYDADEEEEELIVEEELIIDPVDTEETDEVEEIEEEVAETEQEQEASDEEEKPMWAQFLSEEQMEVMMKSREEEEEESQEGSVNDSILVEDDVAEPFVEETAAVKSDQKDLEEHLSPNEEKWVKKMFSGKKKAYTQAIADIEAISNWKDASEFVEKRIFSKYKTDMFSEEAIEFIDALQAYFKEYKS